MKSTECESERMNWNKLISIRKNDEEDMYLTYSRHPERMKDKKKEVQQFSLREENEEEKLQINNLNN